MNNSGLARTRGRALAAGAAVIVGWAPGAIAQSPSRQIAPTPASMRPPEPGRTRPQPISPTTKPDDLTVTPANPETPSLSIPGLEDTDFRIGRARLRSEGTFLVEQRASMIKLPTGERILLFAPDARGNRERPMVLVPCQMLQRMEQMAAERDQPGGSRGLFVVSGQVLAYLGVNYLLPTMCRAIEAAPAPASPTASTPASPPQGKEASSAQPDETQIGKDQSVQDLIKDLEAQREQPRATPAAPVTAASPRAGPAAEPAEPSPPSIAGGTLPEDEMLIRRRGRMVRTDSGQWAFRFDTAPGGDPRLDKPLLLVPCLALQRIEAYAAQRGDAASLEVSGRILAYQGRNYLLPTMYQMYPTNDLEARQGP